MRITLSEGTFGKDKKKKRINIRIFVKLNEMVPPVKAAYKTIRSHLGVYISQTPVLKFAEINEGYVIKFLHC